MVDAKRTQDLTDTDEPKSTASQRDKVAPKRVQPNTDIIDARRATDLSAIEAPSNVKSINDTVDPMRILPARENADPTRM